MDVNNPMWYYIGIWSNARLWRIKQVLRAARDMTQEQRAIAAQRFEERYAVRPIHLLEFVQAWRNGEISPDG